MTLNLALIGCGYWGKNHARVIGENGRASLVYVCDNVRPDNLRLTPGTKFINNYRELIHDASINGVVIATPTATHFDIAKEFLQAGKHVLVEKPLTTRLEQAQELAKLADDNSVRLNVGEVFRFNVGVKYMKQSIERGDLGELRYVECRRVGLGPIRKDVSVLWDLTSHDIYIMQLLAGEPPLSVSYSGVSHNGQLDDIASVNLKFRNGLLGTIYASWEHAIKERQVVVGGTKKAIRFDDLEVTDKIKVFERGIDYQPPTGEFADFQAAVRDGDTYIPRLRLTEPLSVQLNHFLDCIVNPQMECESSGRQAIETVRVLRAAEESRIKGGIHVSL